MRIRVKPPEAILSYPSLFTPRVQTDDAGNPKPGKYECVLIFPKGSDLTEIKKALVTVGQSRFGPDFAKLVKAKKVHWPLHDDPDEVEGKGYPEGSTYVNVRSNNPPEVVSIVPDPNNGGKPMKITDPKAVYPGQYVLATVDAYDYPAKQGKAGVTLGLGNIQIRRDGPRLDNFRSAADDFEADMDAVADLDDLTAPATDGGGASDDDLADLVG